MEHTEEGEITCPGCGTIWAGPDPSVGFESMAEGSFPSRNATTCPLHAAAPELLKALEGLMDHIEQIERGHSPSLLSPSRITTARDVIKATKGDA